MPILKMSDLDLREKRVFMRVDFNIPIQDGRIVDDTRIRASLPGIRHALAQRASLMLVSHLGRPAEGRPDEKDSLAPVAKHLSVLLGVEVPLKRDWLEGVSVEPGKAVLLENCRFNQGEKKDDDSLARKMAVLGALAGKVDRLIPGGGIANTFMLAAGMEIGKSLAEPKLVGEATRIMEVLRDKGAEIPLPVDVVCAREFSATAEAAIKPAAEIGSDDMILDIGPHTAAAFAKRLSEAGTIVWNGPVGVYEFDQFGQGTKAIAQAIAGSGAYSLAGGGETLAAIAKYGVADRISYISTGGGAFLEFLEGKKLPAIEVLEQRTKT